MAQTPHDIKNYCKVHNLFVGNYVMIEENGEWCCGRITDMSRKEYVHISDVWWRNSYGLTASELSERLLSNRLYKITEKDFHEYVRNRQEERARLQRKPASVKQRLLNPQKKAQTIELIFKNQGRLKG